MAETQRPPTRPESWRALPAHTVMALFEDEVALEGAKSALESADVPSSDIETWIGEDGAAAMEGDPKSEGVFTKIARAVKSITPDQPYLDRYISEVRAGKPLIAVGYRHEDDRERIEGVLRRAGGQYMCRIGQWTLTALQ